MAILAIKGHAIRDNEVIRILEMMGGNNANNCCGKYCDRAYYINENSKCSLQIQNQDGELQDIKLFSFSNL